MRYPELVTKLSTLCNGWIVGGAVDNETPKDYDVYIPFSNWQIACSLIPKESTINRMGGFKCISEGVEVDVWTCEMSDLLATDYFSKAFHPKTGVKIIRV